jgi:hypothetical protein
MPTSIYAGSNCPTAQENLQVLETASLAAGGTGAARAFATKLGGPLAVKLGARFAGAGAAKEVDEGIYVIRGAEETYIGQSGNISGRLGQHVDSGRFSQAEVNAAERIGVSGGKTAREIAEQHKIDELGGIRALGNLRNPIGPRRFELMPEGYTRP